MLKFNAEQYVKFSLAIKNPICGYCYKPITICLTFMAPEITYIDYCNKYYENTFKLKEKLNNEFFNEYILIKNKWNKNIPLSLTNLTMN